MYPEEQPLFSFNTAILILGKGTPPKINIDSLLTSHSPHFIQQMSLHLWGPSPFFLLDFFLQSASVCVGFGARHCSPEIKLKQAGKILYAAYSFAKNKNCTPSRLLHYEFTTIYNSNDNIRVITRKKLKQNNEKGN